MRIKHYRKREYSRYFMLPLDSKTETGQTTEVKYQESNIKHQKSNNKLFTTSLFASFNLEVKCNLY
jgi:hypothetical protein